jgi:histidinol dehydrogenase
LIVTDTDLQTQVAQRLAALLKTYVKKEEFYRPAKPKAVSPEKRASATYSNLQTAFEHLQKIAQYVPQKKASFIQSKCKLVY